jgi:parallel beta-helix repeat protein
MTINTPGSYYLAENITTTAGGIDIYANGVTLDLSGFTLAGGTGSGIYIEANNVSVTNGTITGWDNSGVNGQEANNSIFTNLRLYNNGNDGLSAGNGSIIKDCVARDNAYGGITGENGAVVSNCIAYSNTLDGIRVANDAIVKGCTASQNTGDGIQIRYRCLIENNTLNSNGTGIHARAVSTPPPNGDNRIKSNLICNNTTGLDIDTPANYIADNIVKGNTNNDGIAVGNNIHEIPPAWSQTISSASERFVLVLNDEAVLDKETGLVWARETTTEPINWEAAIDYCYNLDIANRKGWRLPTVDELATLIDTSQLSPAYPAGFLDFFNDDRINWSSTSSSVNTDQAWYVSFTSGNANVTGKEGSTLGVRAVRGGH